MISHVCALCKEAGFPNIIAHYKPVPAYQSHTGKAIPALCWDHKNGKVPRHIQEANKAAEPLALPSPKSNTEAENEERNQKSLREIDVEKANFMRQSGMSIGDIAKQLNVHYWRVQRVLAQSSRGGVKADKWGKCLQPLAGLSVGGSMEVALPEKSNLNQLRSILYMRRETMEFRWSVKRVPGRESESCAMVTKLGNFTDATEEPQEEEREEPLATVSVERSVTHSEKLTVSAPETREIALGRRATILLPGAKPQTQLELTPELAQAVWNSLSLEQKAKLIDVDDIFNSFDDDLRMDTVKNVLLVYARKSE